MVDGALGSIAGGLIGNMIMPGVGGLVGSKIGGAVGKAAGSKSGMGVATGLIQSMQANKLKKQADASFPELVDPNQAGYLAELAQKRKSLETGADFAAGMNAIDATNAGTNDAITRSAGGDASGTIQGLLQAQRVAGDAKNQVLAQGQNQQMQYNQMYQGMLDQIAGRKLQLQMQRSQQARAEWAAKQKSAQQNLMGGLASLGNSVSAPASMPNKWASTMPSAPTPTPESAGIQANNIMMDPKQTEGMPMTSGNPSALLSELK